MQGQRCHKGFRVLPDQDQDWRERVRPIRLGLWILAASASDPLRYTNGFVIGNPLVKTKQSGVAQVRAHRSSQLLCVICDVQERIPVKCERTSQREGRRSDFRVIEAFAPTEESTTDWKRVKDRSKSYRLYIFQFIYQEKASSTKFQVLPSSNYKTRPYPSSVRPESVAPTRSSDRPPGVTVFWSDVSANRVLYDSGAYARIGFTRY